MQIVMLPFYKKTKIVLVMLALYFMRYTNKKNSATLRVNKELGLIIERICII